MTKKKYIINPRVKQIIYGIEADVMFASTTTDRLLDYLSYYKEEEQMTMLQKIFSAILRKEWIKLQSRYEHDIFKIVVKMIERDTFFASTMNNPKEWHNFDIICNLYPEIGICKTKTF